MPQTAEDGDSSRSVHEADGRVSGLPRFERDPHRERLQDGDQDETGLPQRLDYQEMREDRGGDLRPRRVSETEAEEQGGNTSSGRMS